MKATIAVGLKDAGMDVTFEFDLSDLSYFLSKFMTSRLGENQVMRTMVKMIELI